MAECAAGLLHSSYGLHSQTPPELIDWEGSSFMKEAPLPTNETLRAEKLRGYGILDTPLEASFDALAKLAANILEVPMALVSLVDGDRQWFKARYGLNVPETPRGISFCAHVVAFDEPLVVPDALADSRFSDNPLVTGEPRVRFYAGVPLRTKDGFVLGTLCAIDHSPRGATERQLESLSLLAGQVVELLEAHREKVNLQDERAHALENSRRLTALFEAMSEGVVVQDRSGVVESSNAAAQRILGLTPEQLSGRSSVDPRWQAIHEDGSPFPGEEHPSMVALRSGEPHLGIMMGVHKPSGEPTWISVNALPLKESSDAPPYGVLTTFHDVTAIKLTQAAADRLSRQERLVTTGTLAAGMGHEINNPLAFIVSNLEYALEEVRAIAGGSPSGRMRELLEVLGEARVGAERIRKIVRGLRALAREDAEPIATDVADAVDISVSMAAHEVRDRATVRVELSPTPHALADESRLSQVLVNLIINAAQAFVNADVERNIITIRSGLATDGRIEISVTDNGPGIPTALHRRIFDPFFTTKAVGQGTGLGLSSSLGIITNLGGELTVESREGRGSTFRVLLPFANAAPGRS